MWWKKIIQIFSGLALGGGLLLGGLFGYFYFHQNNLVKIIVDQVNSRINTTVNVSDISLSLWERFPSVSVKFNDVTIFNAKDFQSADNDTLLRAKNVFADFDLVSLFSDNPQIQTISINDGILYVAVDNQGSYNYNVIKSEPDTVETHSKVSFSMVELSQIAIQYEDYKRKINYNAYFPVVKIQGHIGDTGFSLKTYISISKNNFVPSLGNYLQNIEYDGLLTHFDKNFIEWKGKGSISGCAFDLSGFFNIENQQILVKTDEVTLTNRHIISLLKKYNTSDVLFSVNTVKLYEFRYFKSSKSAYQITSGFYLKSDLKRESDVFKLEVNGQVKYNGKILNAHFEKFEMKTKSSYAHFKGAFSWPKNKVYGNFSLASTSEDLVQLLGIKKITNLKGDIDAQVNVDGVIGKGENYLQLIKDGELGINNVAFSYENYNVENLLGIIDWQNTHTCALKIQAEVNENKINYDGKLHNILGFINKKEMLNVSGSLYSSNLDLDKLIVKSSSSKSSGFAIPQNLNFNIRTKIEHFTKSSFVANNLCFDIVSSGKRFDLKKMNFSMADGNVDITTRMIQQKNNEWYTTLSAKLKHVDVSKTFTNLDNFGQNDLIDKNLSGFLTATVDGDFVLTPHFLIKIPTVFLEADLSISNGAIVNYRPLESLSDFIAVEELQHVKFSDLKNKIKIENSTLYIPFMDIKSSAIDLGIEGSHTFNNQINYRISIGLSDVLFNKFKQKHKEINPLRRNKKMVVDINIKGTTDDFNISLYKLHRISVEKAVEKPKQKKKFEIEFDDIE